MMKKINKQYTVQAGISRLKKVLSVLVLSVLVGGIEAKAAALTVSIADKIKAELSEVNRGKLVAVPSESGTFTFEWYRSTDSGSTWTKVERVIATSAYEKNYYNVDADGLWLDPASDRVVSKVEDHNNRLSYKVKILTKNGEAVGSEIISAPYQIPYYDAIMNGGFENKLLQSGHWHFPHPGNPYIAGKLDPDYGKSGVEGGKYWVSSELTDAKIKEYTSKTNPYNQSKYGYFPYIRIEDSFIWKTTEQSGILEVANASPNKFYFYNTKKPYRDCINDYFGGVVAENSNPDNGVTHGGEQMVEMNAEQASTIYQDVLTVPGSTLYWSLWQRARPGRIDKMAVIIMDAPTAASLLSEYGTKLKDGVMYIRSHPSEFPNAMVSNDLEADVSKWVEHVGEYKVPEGQYLTRFFFASLSETQNQGNLLDDVSFSQEVPEPKSDEAVINIQKTISGELDNASATELKNKIKFRVTVGDETDEIEGKDLQWFAGADGTWTTNFRRTYEIGIGEEVDYLVVEDMGSAAVPNHVLSYSDSGNTKGTLNLTDKKSIDISIENAYLSRSDLIIVKNVLGDDVNLKDHFAFLVTGPNNYKARVLVAPNSSVTIKDLQIGEYTVQEESWSWAYTSTDPFSGKITQDISKNNTFTFKNTQKENNPLHDEAIKVNSIIKIE